MAKMKGKRSEDMYMPISTGRLMHTHMIMSTGRLRHMHMHMIMNTGMVMSIYILILMNMIRLTLIHMSTGRLM